MGTGKSEIATRIRQVRETRGLTQAELADRARMPAAAISHFETGFRTPGTSTLKRLADALGITLEYLLGREEEPKASGPTAGVIFKNVRELSDDSLKLLADFSDQLKKRDEEKRGS